jgi:hypothetical protein
MENELNDSNYFSLENENKFMGVSQFKAFLVAHNGCEAKKMAELKGLWKDEESTALLVGSYFHSHFENTLGTFKAEHPQIFTKQGTLKSEYKKADEMINCLEKDDAFKEIYVGDKEKIYTGELFGVQWKIKVDLLNLNEGYFIDLKTTRDFEKQWIEADGKNIKVTFVEKWGYFLQIAVYREILAQNLGLEPGELEAFIIAATKQDPPDKVVLCFKEEDFQEGLREVQTYINHIMDVKEGRVEPIRCGNCAYCRSTKKLDKAIHWSELK